MEMKPIRVAAWFVMLVSGTVALPSQSQTNHFRTNQAKTKQITPVYFSESESSSLPVASSTATVAVGNDASPDTSIQDDSSTIAKPVSFGNPNDNDAAIMSPTSSSSSSSSSSPLASPSPSPIPLPSTSPSPLSQIPLVSTGRNSLLETIDTIPTTSPVAKTEIGASTTTSDAITVKKTSTTTSPNAPPTETSSRTRTSSSQDVDTFLSSSKKSTASSDQFPTTPASSLAKETRESPGKIRPQIKLTTNYTSLTETGVRLPEGASAALAKPTKYHYYPHNQHIYLLPECAVQQVCNAVYVRLNFTQPLCACPGRYRDPCSASLDSDDLHTTELVTDPRTKALTLVKTCEPVAEMRECRTPRDWSLLALQNVRTGKSHYLVICRCPDANILGPMSHDQPTYASVPGIRVYGMMCVQGNRRGRPLRYARSLADHPNKETGQDSLDVEKEETKDRLNFPWYKVQQLMNAAVWD
ncbi:mucin-5AC isoform X2 [Hylaeus volcanicus]|uniref:mucin-5AC isoform X2 n=1 Tax=Hylaeus volcanicus TaxID=313075 RepID=UPI0023B8772B|nr:mucin-5AC isoform X2 [Hylaeus volcanicus]